MNVADVTTALALLTTMVIGATELVSNLFDRNYRAAAIVGVAALVGGVAGGVLFPRVGIAIGLASGLSAVGIVTTAQNIGKQNPTPTPPKNV